MRLEMVEQILLRIDSNLQIRKLEFVEISSKEHIEAYKKLQDCVDIMIIGGYYDYLFFCNNIIFSKVTGYISRNTTTLFRCLLEAQLSGYDIFNISIDGFQETVLEEIYCEIGYPSEESQLYVWYENHPLSPRDIEDTFLFHQKNYCEHHVSVCITCISSVYEKLRQTNIPAIMINATSENIRLTYEKLHMEYLLKTKETSDVVLLDINVIGNKTSLEWRDDYSLNVEKLHIAELIFLFAQKLQAAVEELNLGHYLILSSSSAFEQESNMYKHIGLLEDMKRFHHCKLSLGIGYGSSLREIQRNANVALQKARAHTGSCAYIVYDRVNVNGPLFSRPSECKESFDSYHSKIAQETGLSVNTIQKLQFIIDRYKSDTFTINELSLIYGVSLRSMYRIIDKLERCGYVREHGKKMIDGSGRPSRIIQIIFEEKSSRISSSY